MLDSADKSEDRSSAGVISALAQSRCIVSRATLAPPPQSEILVVAKFSTIGIIDWI